MLFKISIHKVVNFHLENTQNVQYRNRNGNKEVIKNQGPADNIYI